MKKFLLKSIVVLVALMASQLHAQTLEYSYSGSSESAYYPLTNPTTLINGVFDDQSFTDITIPGITFGGAQQTTITISSNGWIAFGNASTLAYNSPLVILLPGTQGMISAFGRDLRNATSASYIAYQIDGEITTIEWREITRFGAFGENISIQLELDGGQNKITTRYLFAAVDAVSNHPQVGMRTGSGVPVTGMYDARKVSSGESWLDSSPATSPQDVCVLTSAEPAGFPPSMIMEWNSGISGCMDALACNYNPDAEYNNGSCDYCSCNVCGCMDSAACNYNADANVDDGSCYGEITVNVIGDETPCIGFESVLIAQPANGVGPYTYNWNDGSTGSSTIMIALDTEPVIYTIFVTDANGCTGSSSITMNGFDCIWGCLDPAACNYNALANQDDVCDYSCLGCTDSDAMNYDVDASVDDGTCYYAGEGNTCANPISLDCSVGYYENMTVGVDNDNATSGATLCGGVSNGGQRWYTYTASFSSEITVSTINSATNFDTYLKVFTGSCGSLTCVTQNDDVPGTGFQSQVVFNAVEGETYLIRVGGFATMNGSFGLTFDCGGGCLDPEACNYDVDAPFDDGSCTYGADCYGCTDDTAINYDPIAVYDQGCQYNPNIIVFHDLNGNGVHEFAEPGLANWPIYIPAMSATLYTDATGHISANLPASSFEIDLINNTTNWISSTVDQIFIDVPSSMTAEFGLIPSTGETFFVAGPYDGFWDVLHCTNGYEAGVLVNNTGSVPLNGTLTMTCNTDFTPEGDAYGTVPPDQVAAGFAQWNIIDYLAGSNNLFSMHIDGPGVDNIGTTEYFNFNLVLVDAEGNEIYNESWQTTPMIACSYDPNDLTATPEGIYDPHYILPGQRIQYRIRFQNTGNLYAEDITIMDQLDINVFDISTFQPLYASASMVACLHDDGMVDFIFNDIYLPDSTSDEEGSHGFVVFQVEARADLAPNTVLLNQAAIFFEQNPAIITNEVYHTIFDCNSFIGITGDVATCEGEDVNLDATQDYVETYTWFVDNVMSTEPSVTLAGLTAGDHLVNVTTANPLCETTHEVVVTVNTNPSIDAGGLAEICEGESITLMAVSDAEVTWSNGSLNGIEIIPSSSTVLTATATNEFGCQSEDHLEIEVFDLPSALISQEGNILTAADGATWQWFYDNNPVNGATSQSFTTIGDGQYYCIITSANGCEVNSETLNVTNVGGVENAVIRVYPNPVQNKTQVTLPTGVYHLVITDALGQLVFSRDNCSGVIVLERNNFSTGAYMLSIYGENVFENIKLIME